MARLSGYANTMFITSLEWQEGFSKTKIARLGNVMQANNPWKRLVSVHGVDAVNGHSGDFIFPGAKWADYMDIQPGFRDANTIYEVSIRNRKLNAKPLLVEEFSFGENNREELIKTWSAIMSGAAGIGTATGTEAILTVLNIIDYFYLEPLPASPLADGTFALHYAQHAYFLFKPTQSPITIDWLPSNSKWEAAWVNLKTAEVTKAVISTSSAVKMTPPDDKTYGLYLKRKK